jgi:hypothetical protein
MNTAEILELIAKDRRKRAAVIMANPGRYKICNACFCIDRVEQVFCGRCGNYCFDRDPVEIVRLADLLGQRTISLSIPVLPRIDADNPVNA